MLESSNTTNSNNSNYKANEGTGFLPDSDSLAFCVSTYPTEKVSPENTTPKKFKMYEKPCEVCGKVFRRSALIDTPPKCCSQSCLNEYRVGKGYEKYKIDAHWQEQIRLMYSKGVGMGQVTRMAKKIGVPRTKITNFAKKQAWFPRNRLHVPYFWSDREKEIVEKTGRYHPKAVQKRLKKEGFERTISAIEIKRKELRACENRDSGLTANQLAECMGVDIHKIINAIKAGKIKAKRRPTYEGERVAYEITHKAIKSYIINWLPEINLNYCDKFWLIDVLTNAYADNLGEV